MSRDAVSSLSAATKGLWSVFDALWLHQGVIQWGWKSPAMGEVTWQVVAGGAPNEPAWEGSGG